MPLQINSIAVLHALNGFEFTKAETFEELPTRSYFCYSCIAWLVTPQQFTTTCIFM